MTEFLIYVIKSTVYLTVFYAFFILFMKKTTFFRFNRIMFMAASALCFILPAVDVSPAIFAGIDMPMNAIEEALTPAYKLGIDEVTVKAESGMIWLIIISTIYFVGLFSVLGSNIASYIRLYKLLHEGQAERAGEMKVLTVDTDMPSFSWGKYIVISRADMETNQAILTHERMHIKCRHSIDLMLYSLISTIHWFNPLVWVARMELKMLHEYEADELTLKTGINPAQYQLLLVKKTVDSQQFQMANGFYHSKLKNRIIMINKKKTNR
jgi:Zn-dependent protease with chaperone function